MSSQAKVPFRYRFTRGRELALLWILAIVALILIAGLFGYLGQYLWHSVGHLLGEIAVYTTYVPAQGRVLQVLPVPGSSSGISYAYTYENRTYIGNRVHASPILHYQRFASSLARDYQPGTFITVWVDPYAPEKSVLTNRLTLVPLSIGLLPCAFFMIIGTSLALTRKRSRAVMDYLLTARLQHQSPGSVPMKRRMSCFVRRDGPFQLVIGNQTPMRFVILFTLLLAGIGTVLLTIPMGTVFLDDVLPAGSLLILVIFLGLLGFRSRYIQVVIDKEHHVLYFSKRDLFRSSMQKLDGSEIAPAFLEVRPIAPFLPEGKPRDWWHQFDLYISLKTQTGVKIFDSRVWRGAEKDGARYLVRRINYLLFDSQKVFSKQNAA